MSSPDPPLPEPPRPENTPHYPAPPEARYERRDVSVSAVLWLALGILVGAAIAHAVVWWLLQDAEMRAEREDPVPSPVADSDPQPPAPQLQDSPVQDYVRFQQTQQRLLNSYGWIDQKQGTVRIPIERSMELLLERGLPGSAPADGAKPTSATTPTPPTAAPDSIGPIRPIRPTSPTPDSARVRAGEKPLTDRVGLDQRLGSQVPLDLVFRDEAGRRVKLGDLVRDKPVILTLVYFRCPMLCNQVLNGLLQASQAIQFTIGEEYDVITVSIDPRETPAMAAARKERYVARYRRSGAERGWHFLTGDQPSITALADAVGYRYVYDAASDQYAHASGIILLTPQGRVSRYFYGIDYYPNDLRLGLVESSQNEIGTAVDQILLLCYHYDPTTGRYGVAIATAIRAAGTITVVVLGTFLWVMFRQERRRSAQVAAGRLTGSLATEAPD